MSESNENPYAVARKQVLEDYSAYLSGCPAGLFVAVADASLGTVSRNALVKSAEALGYGAEGVTFLEFDAAEPALDAMRLFEVLEGLDPLCMVTCSKQATDLCARAYRGALEPSQKARLFGRDICTFENLDTMMQTDAQKQRAWALLKSLPKRP